MLKTPITSTISATMPVSPFLGQFILYPAIDCKAGKVVRLKQGDFNHSTEYNHDILEQAKIFVKAGARWLHIINLDAALLGEMAAITNQTNNPPTNNHVMVNKNWQAIEQIIQWRQQHAPELKIQLGGGIKNSDIAKQWLNLTIDRLIIGSMAIKNPKEFEELVQQYPQQIALALDCKKNKVKITGWTKDADLTLIQVVKKFQQLPLAAIIYTDIERDGTGTGANHAIAAELVEYLKTNHIPIPVIISGGINSLQEIESLQMQKKFGGVVLGHALYENKIQLQDLKKF